MPAIIASPDRTLESDTVLSGGSYSGSLPLANIKNPLLSKVARTTNALAASSQFNVVFGSQREVRLFALLNHNLSLAATVRAKGYAHPGYGGDLVTNGGFTTDTWWGKSAGATISGGTGIFTNVSANNGFYNGALLITGRSYSVTYTIVSITSGSVASRAYDGISTNSGVTRNAPGTYTDTLVSPGTRFGILATVAGTNAVIDDVIVVELPSETGTQYVWPQTFTSDEVSQYPNHFIFPVSQNTTKYWSVEIIDTTNSEGYIQFGRCWIGPAIFSPAIGPSYGASLGYESGDNVSQTRYGVRWGSEGSRLRKSAFVFDTLTSAEKRKALIMQKILGTIGEIIWIPSDTLSADDRLLEAFPATIRSASPITYPYFNNHEMPMEVLEFK